MGLLEQICIQGHGVRQAFYLGAHSLVSFNKGVHCVVSFIKGTQCGAYFI